MPKLKIHHTQKKMAENIGVTLSVSGDGKTITAFWPERGVTVHSKTASGAIEDIKAKQAEYRENEANTYVEPGGTEPEREDPKPHEANGDKPLERLIERNEHGVPLDGAIAFAEKFTAADCPFTSEEPEDGEESDEYERFLKWNEDFDNAADAAEEDEGGGGGSVVAGKYRARYAEMGHPTHCGDDLAVILNNLCLVGEGHKATIDLPRFEAICAANGVDLSKYNRTRNGWQGRLRMTGRNMLARRVYEADGVLLTPIEGAEPQYKMSGEWMESRRFKATKKAA